MSGGQRVRYLKSDLQHLRKRHRSALHDLLQSFALNVFHDDEVETVLFIDRMNRNNVRMVQRRGGARLLHQAPFCLIVFNCVRRQKLKRHHAAKLCIFGLIDVAHAALANLADDTIVQKCFPWLENTHGKNLKSERSEIGTLIISLID